MTTLLVTEVRVYRINYEYYADNSFTKILERYEKKFSNITLMTRVVNSDFVPNGYINITKLIYNIYDIGSIIKFMIFNRDKNVPKYVKTSDFIILRMHSIISAKIYRYIKKYNKTYMVEVMGCAWDAYWNHGIKGKLIAMYGYCNMKRIIKNANYAIYVTKYFLQNRYPCNGICINASNVNISDISIPKEYKNFDRNNFTMMTAAAMNVKYKGQSLVIKAISKLKKEGVNINYYLAGKGDNKYLQKIAKKYKVDDRVFFLGMLNHNDLLKKMKEIDIYIQPSLQEGLPRSLIEAMSQGTICLGSTTAGIPELLSKDQLFQRGKVSKIIKSIKNNLDVNYEKISRENINTASEYISKKLDNRRSEFFNIIIKNISK